MAGGPNSVKAVRNARMKPLRMAGATSGSVTLKPGRNGLAPRMAAASSTSLLMRSRAFVSNANTNGKQYKKVTKISPATEYTLNSGVVDPLRSFHQVLITPAFGPASNVQQKAPRNGGVTNEASTRFLI